MAMYKLLGTAAALALMSAPSVAQQAMGEPGYCAFYYPNANCQNKGPGNPYTGDSWLRFNHAAAIAASPPDRVVRRRAPRHQSSMQ
ncbi:MAG: hypothetical protein ABW175_21495 [Bradyrhizobium sp.]